MTKKGNALPTRINVRMTDEEKQLLKDAADASGIRLSDFIRITSLKAARALLSGSDAKVMEAMNSTGRLLIAQKAFTKDENDA